MFQDQDIDRDLYNAAALGNLEEVQNLLKEGNVNVNCRNIKGNTPLYIASAWGYQDPKVNFCFYEIVQLLIDSGADINLPNNTGKTPLYVASAWGHFNIVTLLIKNEAKVNEKMKEGRTALHIACLAKPHVNTMSRGEEYGNYKHKYQAYLLAKSFMESVGSTGKYSDFLPNLDKDYKEMMSYSEADLEKKVPDEIMNIVVYYNHFATVAALVQAKAELNVQDERGETPLGKAAYAGHLGIVKFLVDKGADIGITDKRNRIAIDIAEEEDYPRVAKFLKRFKHRESQGIKK